jgi:FMN phosphatase YigB (HAD superfamily)
LSNEKPTSIFVDFDNTLYDYASCNSKAQEVAAEIVSKELGVSKEQVVRSIESARTKVKNRLGSVASSHSRILYLQEALIEMGFASKPYVALKYEQTYWSEFLIEMKPNPGAKDFLDSARFQKIPLVMVTDLTSQIQIRKLIYLGWELTFDYVITSELVGSEKESGAPFDFALNLLTETERNNVWFIGDQTFDVPDISVLKTSGVIQDGKGFLIGQNDASREYVSQFKDFFELEATIKLSSD